MQSDKFHHVEITLQPFERGHTLGTVKLDGVELRNVRSVKIESGHSQITEVTFTVIAAATVNALGANVVFGEEDGWLTIDNDNSNG